MTCWYSFENLPSSIFSKFEPKFVNFEQIQKTLSKVNMKIRACEVVPEDVEAVRAEDGEVLSEAEDDIIAKHSQTSSSQTSKMTIILDEDQVVSDNEESDDGVEKTAGDHVKTNLEADKKFGFADEDQSSDTENQAEDSVLDLSAKFEAAVDEYCEPEAQIVEEDSDSKNKIDFEEVEEVEELLKGSTEESADEPAEESAEESLEVLAEESAEEQAEESHEDKEDFEDRISEDDRDFKEDIDDQARVNRIVKE